MANKTEDFESFWTSYCGSPAWHSYLLFNLELTPCFEQIILSWIPLVFLWIFTPLDIYLSATSNFSNIAFNAFNISKLVFNSALIFFSIFDFAYNETSKSVHEPYYFWTPALQFLSYATTFCLTIFHVKKGRCSSGILFVFWALSVFLNIPAFHTQILQFINKIHSASNISSVISFILKSFILILNLFADSHPLESKLLGEKSNISPENFASAWSYFTISWFDSMVFKGYRKPLALSDLWNLDPELTSDYCCQIFEKHWDKAVKSKAKSRSKKEISVVGPCLKSFYKNYLIAHVMKITSDCLVFLNPFIIKSLLSFINSDEQNNWRGFLLAGLLIVTSHINYCLTSNFILTASKFGYNCKSAIVEAIFKKSLRLSVKARKESSFGEISNLIILDAAMIESLGHFVMFAWTAPLQLIVIFILLYQLLGWSVIASLLVLAALFPINYVFAKKINVLQAMQMASKDTRTKMINEMISGIKVLKFNSWEPFFQMHISGFRDKETDGFKRIAYLKSTLSCIWSCSICFMIFTSFSVFVLSDKNNVLDVETAFTSISLFNILHWTTFMLPAFISFITQANVSIHRVNNFLNRDEYDTNAINHSEEKDDLIIERGSFSWDQESQPILNGINIRVKKGSLVAVVGPVGSGKSSLLSAFLGEMNKISGLVNTFGTIAYVPQVAWIQNDTLKGNILFGKKFDEARYSTITNACALKEDFKMLPSGDETEIGEKGINLSGGQKQRINLARAIYFDSDIYFLDDPLSAVDSVVGKHIFQNVIGQKGILRHKTRLFVTHSVSYLQETDYIISFRDGSISEMGTYNELMDSNGPLKELMLNYLKDSKKTEDFDGLNEKEVNNSNSKLITSQFGDEVEPEVIYKRKSSEKEPVTKTEQEFSENQGEGKGNLTEEELTETGSVSWPVIFNYGKAIGVKFILIIIMTSIIRQGFTVGANYWISVWSTDESLLTNGTDNKSRRDMYLSVYSIFILCQALSSYLADLIPLIACLKASIFLHSVLLKTILKAPLWFFDTTPRGRIISRFSKDIDCLDNILPSNLSQAINLFFEICGIVLVITFQSQYFILLLIPVGFLYYLVRKFFISTSTQVKRLESVTRSPIYSHFSETFTGLPIIKAFNVQDRFISLAKDKVDTNVKCTYASMVADCWMAMKLEIVSESIVLFAAVSAILLRHTTGAGTIAMTLTYAITISRVFLMFMTNTIEVERNIVSSERIKEYNDIAQEKPWVLDTDEDKCSWPEKGEIIFRDFKARYREGLDLVLKGISFTINPGEKIGVVGRTGAGKSSLTLCLFKILEPAGGSILIDGIDISTIGILRLRSSLNIISQDPLLFSGSLRLNLDPLGKYSDEEIWKALELVHFKSFVLSLSSGLQYEISEDGQNLSVGQRQLVCLARALLNKTKILIMDEATAAIDVETDELIQKTIRDEFSMCTVLTIAHRIETIMDSERVLVLDGGLVAEFDSPGNLLAQPNSLFKSLAYTEHHSSSTS